MDVYFIRCFVRTAFTECYDQIGSAARALLEAKRNKEGPHYPYVVKVDFLSSAVKRAFILLGENFLARPTDHEDERQVKLSLESWRNKPGHVFLFGSIPNGVDSSLWCMAMSSDREFADIILGGKVSAPFLGVMERIVG